MTLKTTKAHLIQLLSDSENKVVALSGKWGTGKSHLWRELKESSHDDKVKSALYVSLFGLGSMDDVKLRIVQSAIPNAEGHPRLWEGAKQTTKAVIKTLEGFHKSFSALNGLNELALLVVPSILKDKVIVLDDIERKHDKLSIDEVMGFIDEFTQQHGARIILILNSDQLGDRSMWDKLREKVIDQEVRLDTSPAEAFDIAVGLTPSAYADRIRKTVEICGITNIRIICKIVKAINRILSNREDLSDEVLGRVIPSTVLLSAIHYKGIENGPSFDFVLNVGSPDNWGELGKKEKELDEEGKVKAKWRLQLQELGILGCDEYEQLIVDFLKSGLFDVAEVTKVIDRYATEAEIMKAQHLARQFHDHMIWHHRLSVSELIAEAENLAKFAHLLDVYNVTSLHSRISGLDGGAVIADSIIDNWIAEFRKRETQEFDFDNFFKRPIHPRIEAAFNAARADSQAKSTVFDACAHIAKNSGWGHKQEVVMKSASVLDFEATIKSLDTEELRLFMCRFIDLYLHRGTYEKHFGTAMDHFVEACRNICTDPNSGRLGDLIKLLFIDTKLEEELNLPPLETTTSTTIKPVPD